MTETETTAPAAPRSTLRQALAAGEFAVTCEFVPGRGHAGPGVDAVLAFARAARTSDVRVHAISLTDNPGGNPALLPDALAADIQKEGIEALVHFSCRDMNRNAMESRAMALARGGIHNLLVVSGDYPEGGHLGRAMPVFDMDAVQAIAYLKAMNAGLEVAGHKPGTTVKLPPTAFLIGTAVSPFKLTEAELMAQFFKLERKIAAGAGFVVTQLGFDMRKFLEVRRYLAARGLNVPVIGNVYVPTPGSARAMAANKVPGCMVSEAFLALLTEEAKAPDKGKAARLERAARMVACFRGMGFAGAHIGGFGLAPDDYFAVVRRADALAPDWESLVAGLQFGSPGEYYAFPKPARYGPAPADPDPLPRLGTTRKPLLYRFALLMHAMLFEPRSPLFKLARRVYQALPQGRLPYRLAHGFEWWVKRQIFGCRDCGDCALMDAAYVCPMHNCAKQLRNGPCGGSRDGVCEVYPDEGRPCAWARVYERLKSSGDLERLRGKRTPPRNAMLERTSAWANYYLGRDHQKLAPPGPHTSSKKG